jgi:hypothetical protein
MSNKGIDTSKYGDVPLNRLEPGTVVYAHVAFRDDPLRSKLRPVVVIEKNGRTITGCPIYSKTDPLRIETYRRGRRGYVDRRAVVIDKYSLVNLDELDLDDETWDVLADCVIFPEVACQIDSESLR